MKLKSGFTVLLSENYIGAKWRIMQAVSESRHPQSVEHPSADQVGVLDYPVAGD